MNTTSIKTFFCSVLMNNDFNVCHSLKITESVIIVFFSLSLLQICLEHSHQIYKIMKIITFQKSQVPENSIWLRKNSKLLDKLVKPSIIARIKMFNSSKSGFALSIEKTWWWRLHQSKSFFITLRSLVTHKALLKNSDQHGCTKS